MYKILIVEDDIKLKQELKHLLIEHGYQVETIDIFENVKEQIQNKKVDLILLDITIPNMNGQFLLKEIRKQQNTPIIMVTSRDSEVDELLSMSYGADDYITKPYNPEILLLHIEAVLKRFYHFDNVILNYQTIQIDISKSVILYKNQEIELSKNEMKILYFLYQHKGTIVSRDDIMNYLWDMEEFVDDNTLTVNMKRLRNKLEQCDLKEVIQTKRGQGYLLI